MNDLDEIAVHNFREYLKIPSVHPDIDYDDCVKFIQKQARGLNLPVQVYEPVSKKPLVVISWIGKDPTLPTVLLNSHMDVVPVYPEKWTRDPFGAEMDENGNIYARGAQDMKCVAIQYLEAIRRLRGQGVRLKRTIHVLFSPDEETGGILGMKVFVKTEEFRNLNVGFGLDEGKASSNDVYALANGERCNWTLRFYCPGQAGHGSLLIDNTAGEKVTYILQKLYEFRAQEQQKLKENPSLLLGDVTTVNATQLEGGVQSNVIPDELSVLVDNRNPVTVDLKQWEETLEQWCKNAGDGVWVDYEDKSPQIPVTKLDETNPYWIAMKAAADKMKLKLQPQIFSGGTDSRYIREIGLPAIGFSPMINTPSLAHAHDEYLNRDVFLDGVKIYMEIITAVANVL